MLWTAGTLSGVIAVYFAVIYWARATKAHKSGPQWGLGALVVYLAIMGVIYLVIRLLSSPLGLHDYMQIWISCVLWFIVTLTAGVKTDSIFADKLPVANS
jgi:peptidoglycan biosynthesis protein MviN/MurJ (putative lipid II flippase)